MREPALLTNIVLCEDHPFVQLGLKNQLMQSFPMIQNIRTALSGTEALRLIKQQAPDLAIIDLQLPDISGIEVLREIYKQTPDVKCLVVTSCNNVLTLRQLITLQVHGIVLKSSPVELLKDVIETIFDGERLVLDPKVQALLNQDSSISFTPREYEILEKIVQGQSNPEIAKDLQCAVTTIRFHRANIMQKGHFRNVAELTAWFLKEAKSQ